MGPDYAYVSKGWTATWTDVHGNKYEQVLMVPHIDDLPRHYAWVIETHIITEYKVVAN